MGARSAGLAYASSCLSDEWSVHNNPGGMGNVKSSAISFSYDKKPSLESADRAAMAMSLPTSSGTFSFGIFRFGDNIYCEQKAIIGYGNHLGIASLGATIQYIQYNAQNVGQITAITGSLGGIVTLTPSIKIGAYIQNVNQPSISSTSKERLPTLLTLGIGLIPANKTQLTIELQKDLDYKAIIKSGFEYWPNSKFATRTGFSVNPNAIYFGIGFKGYRLLFDYAIQYLPVWIGISHQVSVGYKLNVK